jgi:phosphoribosylamine--glycine ligase
VRVLVVGGGGREHALCWALHRDATSTDDLQLFAAPGNPGTADLGTNLPIAATAIDDIVAAAEQDDIDLTIVGPEAPLAAGLADRLRAAGRSVFGPSAAAARLESSKAYAKEVMRRAGAPTAASETFTDVAKALDYIAGRREPLVVKASGLAAGKGAVVCATRHDAAGVAQGMLAGGTLGEAGAEILVEDFLDGEELSVLALTDGERILILPPAQDHKRLGEGDTGPNTGGMGAYCPVSLSTPELLGRVRREVLEPVLREMAAQGASYEGVLYAGVMVASDGTPYVLEFNCRFGDPETQALLPVLPRGWTEHLAAIAARRWRPPPGAGADLVAPHGAAVTTVLAARGYPDSPEKGVPIELPSPADLGGDVLVFHAGTARDTAGTLRTAGGRVLSVTGLGADVPAAARASAAACERIRFAGKTWRRDVGWREIRRERAGAT